MTTPIPHAPNRPRDQQGGEAVVEPWRRSRMEKARANIAAREDEVSVLRLLLSDAMTKMQQEKTLLTALSEGMMP